MPADNQTHRTKRFKSRLVSKGENSTHKIANPKDCHVCTAIYQKITGQIESKHHTFSPGQFIHWMRNKDLMLDLIREVV